MPRALNLVGKRFGNLVVVNKCDHKSNSGKVLWLCRCDCGGTIETATGNLTKGITTHCKECIFRCGTGSIRRKRRELYRNI